MFSLVQFLVIPKKPIVKLPEAESSNESSLWHLMTASKQYAANSGLTVEFWRAVNELPQGRQAACYLHLPLWANVTLMAWHPWCSEHHLQKSEDKY
uniref:Uncharacterized protein n=1 Tax=Cyanistes caeruleus TaxID=156563 RepID=A0A8C0ZI82_CYACU